MTFIFIFFGNNYMTFRPGDFSVIIYIPRPSLFSLNMPFSNLDLSKSLSELDSGVCKVDIGELKICFTVLAYIDIGPLFANVLQEE